MDKTPIFFIHLIVKRFAHLVGLQCSKAFQISRREKHPGVVQVQVEVADLKVAAAQTQKWGEVVHLVAAVVGVYDLQSRAFAEARDLVGVRSAGEVVGKRHV